MYLFDVEKNYPLKIKQKWDRLLESFFQFYIKKICRSNVKHPHFLFYKYEKVKSLLNTFSSSFIARTRLKKKENTLTYGNLAKKSLRFCNIRFLKARTYILRLWKHGSIEITFWSKKLQIWAIDPILFIIKNLLVINVHLEKNSSKISTRLFSEEIIKLRTNWIWTVLLLNTLNQNCVYLQQMAIINILIHLKNLNSKQCNI